MTISNNISLLAQSNAQANRLNDLRGLMDDLSRQATTQKKYETYSGFGTDSLNLQRLKSQQPLLRTYMSNIDRVSNRMTLMNSSLSNIANVGNQMITAIQTLIQNGDANVDNIRQLAQQSLQVVEEMINQNVDGHYLFAGSDINNPPFVDDSILNSNFQTQIANWLASGDNTTLLTNTNAFSDANLGLSAGLSSSDTVTARIDDNLDVDYTIKADEAGFQDMLRVLGFLSNFPYPDPNTDVATGSDFRTVMSDVLATAQNAVQEINDTSQKLASKFLLIKSIRDNHASDLDLNITQIDKIENADPTEVLTKMQVLQTQLTASYQITKVVSQLSLVNFL